MRPALKLLSALGLFAAIPTAGPARAADLAPGNPPLTQDIADLRRDAVEVVFDVQFTARQLREHQRMYAWYWKFATAVWQKAEKDMLPAFKDAFEKDEAHRNGLKAKHAEAMKKDAAAKAVLGSPYHKWLLDTVAAANKEIAAGPPALRKGHLDNTLEFLQWGLKMQLTVGQQEAFLAMVPKEWNAETSKGTREVIVKEFLPAYRKVVRFTPDQRAELFKLVEPMLKDAMKTPESALDKWLIDAYAHANKVLADGPPDQLTAGATLQFADYYDWALGVRLDEATRAELANLILQDWKGIESTRKGALSTARLMDDPPKGGMGELSRRRDTASLLSFITAQPNNKVNAAAHAAYVKAYPTDQPLPVPAEGAVLAKGEKPLTEGTAERCRLYFEWLFGFEFTADERKKLRELLIDEWTRDDKDALEGTLSIAFDYGRLAAYRPLDRDLMRAFDLPRSLDAMKAAGDKDKTSVWLLERYAAKRPSLVKGQFGPTQDDVAALGDLLHFRVTEVTGGDTALADKVKAATLDKAKAGTLPSYEVSGMTKQLAVLRHAWPTLSEADRQELRDQWADALRAVGVKAKLAAWQTTPAASREMDFLAAQKALMQQQQNTAMISNMMRMQHQTNMAIIRNMGGTPYKYEYKYEYRRR